MNKKLIISLVSVVTLLSLPIYSGEALDTASHEPDFIINPSFEKDVPSWNFEDPGQAAILAFTHDDFDVEDGAVAAVVHVNQAQPYYRVQLKQENLALAAGHYDISFYAKSFQPAQATIALTQQGEPWDNYGLWSDFSTTSEWRQFRVSFDLTNDITDGRLTFYLGRAVTTYFLDDIQLNKITVPTDRTKNLVLNGDFEYPSLGRWDWENLENKATFESTTTESKSGESSARITIGGDPTREWQTYSIQLKQNQIPLEEYQKYEISFAGKVGSDNSACPLLIRVMNDESPWNSVGYERTYDLSSDWQEFKDVFMTSQSLDNARLSFQLGRCQGDVYLDKVKLERW